MLKYFRRALGTAGRTLLALALLAASTGCGVPSNRRVRADFLTRYPNHTVLFVGVGEGDGGNAYFHIRYRKSDNERVFEQIWLYQDLGQKGWTCSRRSNEIQLSTD